jgi:hypothetical protein
MVNIDSGAVHLKMSAIESIEGKRAILESEINALNLLENFKRFKEHRKQESIERGKAVRLMNEIAKDIDNTLELLPKKEEPERETAKKASKKKGTNVLSEEKEKDEISEKLKGIKKKLAELNSA